MGTFHYLVKPNMSYKIYNMNIVQFLLHFLLHQVFVYFSWSFIAFEVLLKESFIGRQIKLEFSPEITSALENKKLLSHFRVFSKRATSAQTDAQVTTDHYTLVVIIV